MDVIIKDNYMGTNAPREMPNDLVAPTTGTPSYKFMNNTKYVYPNTAIKYWLGSRTISWFLERCFNDNKIKLVRTEIDDHNIDMVLGLLKNPPLMNIIIDEHNEVVYGQELLSNIEDAIKSEFFISKLDTSIRRQLYHLELSVVFCEGRYLCQ